MIGAANTSDTVGWAMAWVLSISLILFVAVTGTMIAFAIIYNRKRRPKVSNIEGNLWLEIIWTVIPIVIVLGIFWIGFSGYIIERRGPAGTRVVNANGVMWAWSFSYENGTVSPELYLPVNEPVKIVTHSVDVLHSFYIPAFRIKQDAVPGLNNHIFFTPQRIGQYDVFCAEYCGKSHAKMLTKVNILSKSDFDQWYNKNVPAGSSPSVPSTSVTQSLSPKETAPGTTSPPTSSTPAATPSPTSNSDVAKGEELYKSRACSACHSTDGSKMLGPSWKGIWGHQVKFKEGGAAVVNDAYIKESILNPSAKTVEGYTPGSMPPQQLNDTEIKAIIAFIKTLK